MLKLYREVFDTERERVFQKLSAFKADGVLAGGTALALQLGHRKSFDFDIFIPKSLSKHFFKKVIGVFGKNITTRVSTGDIIMIETSKKIEVHLVYFWRKRLFKTVKTPSLNLLSVGDIAADKAYTIGRRGEWRDYVDVFFLLKKRAFSLPEIVKMADKKYQPEFNPRLFLEQLTYFGDIKDFIVSFLRESYEVKDVKRFLIKEAKKAKKTIFRQQQTGDIIRPADVSFTRFNTQTAPH